MKYLLNFPHFYLLFLILLNSCKSSTEPEDKFKDPRDMVWTVDTLFFHEEGQTIVNQLFAIDRNNVYASGWCVGFWKYNGDRWNRIDLLNSLGAFQAHDMIGFSNSNIFCFGEVSITRSKIVHFDGLTWNEFTSAGTVAARLLTACADKSTNIYAGGDNGWILYFNGTTWQKDQIKMYVPKGGAYFLRSSAVWKDTTFFTAYNNDHQGREVYYLIKGKFKNWKISDSMVIDNSSSIYKWGWWGLYVSPDNKLMSYGSSGVWEYNGNEWDHKLTTENVVRGVFSLGSNYTIAAGALNEVYFNNGSV